MKAEEHPYAPDRFNREYYGGSARGGFTDNYAWENPIQQEQLNLKLETLRLFGPVKNVLFVGCARGWEVRKAIDNGIDARGVDISTWAIDNADPHIAAYVQRYDGSNLGMFKAGQFQIVAAFDVLTLVPDAMMEKLASEMCRVAAERITFRTIIKTHVHGDDPWHGNDGVTFRYKPFEHWVQLFSQNGFAFDAARIASQFEMICSFTKQA